jgi:hypothetical protein
MMTARQEAEAGLEYLHLVIRCLHALSCHDDEERRGGFFLACARTLVRDFSDYLDSFSL